jgi:hypothetical protein
MKKITNLKLANSVRIGNGEETYLTEDKFDLALDGVLIHVRDKAVGNEITTSVFNTIWFKLDKNKDNNNGQKKSQGSPKGTQEEASE